MSNITSGDDRQPFIRNRMTRSVGLVLIGTAAFMLGMPGCDDRGSNSGSSNGYSSDADPASYGQGYSSTQPSRNSSSTSSSHHYYTSGRRTTPWGWSSSSSRSGSGTSGSHSSSGASSHTSRGGFGSTGHHVAS
jgi:hypothetical protein